MASDRFASVWAILGGAGSRGVSFLFFLLIAREISPHELGVMAIGLAISTFIDAINELGMVEQMVRQTDEASRLLSSVFWLQLGSGALSATVLLAASPWLVAHYGESQLTMVLAGVAFGCVLTAANYTPLSILLRRMAFRSIAVRDMSAALIGGSLGLYLARHGRGVEALVAMHVVNLSTSTVVTWIAAAWRPRWVFDRVALGPALSLGKHTLGARMMDTFTSRVDQLLVGSFFGTTVLGLYSLAMRFFDVVFQSICLQMSSVVIARLSATAHDIQATTATYLKQLRQLSLVGPPLFLGAALFLPEVLSWVIAPKWAQVAPYIQIIMGMGVLLAITFSHSLFFTVIARPQINFWISACSTAVWLVAMFYIPTLGAIFAAVLWAARMAMGIPFQLFFLKRLTDIQLRDYARQIWPMVVSCGGMLAIAGVMHINGWINHIQAPLQLVLGMGLCGAIALLMLLNHAEFRQSRTMV